MRNRVFLSSHRTELSIVFGLVMALALSAAGCGGGGGGSNNGGGGGGGNTPPPNSSLATISGFVRDTSPSHNPVQGAVITITGTSRSATTNAAGSFTVTDVPLTAVSFKVASPNAVAYYNYANYNGKLYDLVACVLKLPALVAGANAPFTDVDMYIGGANPPPPPPVGGCPS